MEQHPLEIELILDRIFSYLKTQELLKCREMCSQWNFNLTPKLYRDPKITIHLDSAFNPKWKFLQWRYWISKPLRNMEEYSKFLETAEYSFPNISIDLDDIPYDSLFLKDFLGKWGHTLKHLTLHLNTSSKTHHDNWTERGALKFNECNLESLDVKDCHFFDMNPLFIQDRLSTGALKLRVLKLGYGEPETLEKAVILFPNVTRLEATCDQELSYRAAISLWKHLEILDVSFCIDEGQDMRNLDGILCGGNLPLNAAGIYLTKLEGLRQLKITLLWSQQFQHQGMEDNIQFYRNRYNLRNLEFIQVTECKDRDKSDSVVTAVGIVRDVDGVSDLE